MFNLFLKISQTLEDYANGTARDIIKGWDEEWQEYLNQYYSGLADDDPKMVERYILNLKKAIRTELGIIVKNIDLNEVDYFLSRVNEVRENENLKRSKDLGNKTFESLSSVLVFMEHGSSFEIELDSNEKALFDELSENPNYSDFINKIKSIAYKSSMNMTGVNLQRIKDWYDLNSEIPFRNQQDLNSIVGQWNSNLVEKALKLSNEMLRKTPNKSQGGQPEQEIVLNAAILSSIPDGPDKDAIMDLNTSKGLHMVELNDERSLYIEGERLMHCVHDYVGEVKDSLYEVYSLRDNKNAPHATIDTQYRHGAHQILQIKGKQDDVPVDRYRPFIMQWILNNSNLKVHGDIEGCLYGNMFSNVLEPYENVDNWGKIKNVNLGEQTIYKRDFIDQSANEKILFTQTKNMEFLRNCLGQKGWNSKFSFICDNTNLDLETQKYIISLDTHDEQIANNPSLFPECQNMLVDKRNSSVLEKLTRNTSLSPSLHEKLFEIVISFSDDMALRCLASSPSLIPELKWLKDSVGSSWKTPIPEKYQEMLVEKSSYILLKKLSMNTPLSPKFQWVKDLILNDSEINIPEEYKKIFIYKLLDSGIYGTLERLLSQTPLSQELQEYLVRDSDERILKYLSKNPSLIPEIRDQLIEKGIIKSAFNLGRKKTYAFNLFKKSQKDEKLASFLLALQYNAPL